MSHALLHVVSACIHTQAEAENAVRFLRHALPSDESCAMLLFCDLPDAEVPRLPCDDPLIRTLQSGVMCLAHASSRRAFLLVRSRQWHDALRRYAGASQTESPRRVIADLLIRGESQARFEAATRSPASLKGQYTAVLFSSLSLSCTPDVPARMLRMLSASSQRCLCAAVRPRRAYPHSALSRLYQLHPCGLSLSPIRAAQLDALAAQQLSPIDAPMLCTLDALSDGSAFASAAPVAAGCAFVRSDPPALRDCFAAYRSSVLSAPSARAALTEALPLLQLALLFLSAWIGNPLPAMLALFLPECYTLLRPRMLPSTLLRMALLPITALVALDALLLRAGTRKRLVLRIPDGLITPLGAVLHGTALLSLALVSTHALVPLLPLSLLWLAAPLLVPALDAPTLERIPLSDIQRSQLLSEAESAFFDAHASVPAVRPFAMLAACAGCMLGLLEPDEAARRIQSLLPDTPSLSVPRSAAEIAAQLAAAQYLRECMSDCDAALRALPTQLEQLALQACPPEESGALAAFLRAACFRMPSMENLLSIHPLYGIPLDALFLPLGPSRAMAQHPLTLPLTHPHTYLHRVHIASIPPKTQFNPIERFLILAGAALDHPFYPLLLRSPLCAPYASLLSL